MIIILRVIFQNYNLSKMKAIVIVLPDNKLDANAFSLELGKSLAERGIESQISTFTPEDMNDILIKKSVRTYKRRVEDIDYEQLWNDWNMSATINELTSYINCDINNSTKWVICFCKTYAEDLNLYDFVNRFMERIVLFIENPIDFPLSMNHKKIRECLRNLSVSGIFDGYEEARKKLFPGKQRGKQTEKEG